MLPTHSAFNTLIYFVFSYQWIYDSTRGKKRDWLPMATTRSHCEAEILAWKTCHTHCYTSILNIHTKVSSF